MKICIDCQKDVSGMRAVRIKEDRIIGFIRKVKTAMKIAKGNELYVCEDDLPKHLERRKSFEKTMVIFTVLAAIIVLLLLVTILLSGRIELWTVASAILIGVLLLLFSLVFKYVPAVENTEPVQVSGGLPAKKKRRKKKRGE